MRKTWRREGAQCHLVDCKSSVQAQHAAVVLTTEWRQSGRAMVSYAWHAHCLETSNYWYHCGSHLSPSNPGQPHLWHLSSACLSIWGLKSTSWRITVSAPVRFSPWPHTGDQAIPGLIGDTTFNSFIHVCTEELAAECSRPSSPDLSWAGIWHAAIVHLRLVPCVVCLPKLARWCKPSSQEMGS
jgi:hypothetical protein